MISFSNLPICFVFHKGANPLRKLALDSKGLSQTEKEPSLWQAGSGYDKTNKYNNDLNYNKFKPACIYIRLYHKLVFSIKYISTNSAHFLENFAQTGRLP